MEGESDPGVPEALPRILRAVAERFGAATLDRVWIFPPKRKGRKEWGLVAVSRYERVAGAEGGAQGGRTSDAPEQPAPERPEPEERASEEREAAPDRRRLYTAAYTAERTGHGLTVEPVLTEEGRAPLDRLPRIMQGVVRRSDDERGEAREIEIGGDSRTFEELVEEFDALVDPEPGSILEP